MSVSGSFAQVCLTISLIIAAVAVVSACGATGASRADSDKESSSGWDVLLVNFGEYHDMSPRETAPSEQERRLLVADVRITNTQERPASYTFNDFELTADNRRVFKPDLQTANVERGLVFVRVAQPRATSESRILFDVDRPLKTFTLTVLKKVFRVSAP
jgi:hypothetical protein